MFAPPRGFFHSSRNLSSFPSARYSTASPTLCSNSGADTSLGAADMRSNDDDDDEDDQDGGPVCLRGSLGAAGSLMKDATGPSRARKERRTAHIR